MSLASEWPEPSGGLVPAGVVLGWDDDDDPSGAVGPELEALAIQALTGLDTDPEWPAEQVPDDVGGWEPMEGEADPLVQLAAIEAADELDAHQRRHQVADLDDDALLDAAAANQKAINTGQAHQLVLAAQWADLHNADAMRPPTQPEGSAASRYGEGLICPGGDGTPGFAEFAPATLAGALGVSATSATHLMADALDLRHRLPILWGRLQSGGVKVWMARRVAAATRHLSQQAAARVDARLAGLADTLTGRRFAHTLKAAVAAADPAEAKARAEANRRRRGVWVDPDDQDGVGTLFARAAACDLIAFSKALDVVAAALKVLGDPDDADARRSKAVGILARPQAALDLVHQAEQARRAASQAAAARRNGKADPQLEDKADRLGRFSFAPATLYIHLSDQTLRHAASGDDGDPGLVRVEDVGPLLADRSKTGCSTATWS